VKIKYKGEGESNDSRRDRKGNRGQKTGNLAEKTKMIRGLDRRRGKKIIVDKNGKRGKKKQKTANAQ